MVTNATLFIKKVKKIKNGKTLVINGKEVISEWLWVNFRINGKRERKSLKLKNTAKNRKKAELTIIPKMIELINQNIKSNKEYEGKVPTVDKYVEYSFSLHKGRRSESTSYGHEKNYEKYIKNQSSSHKCIISEV